jgi:hypothetical protein
LYCLSFEERLLVKDSDADFNVGLALGALQTMDKYGVYIAMNGQINECDQMTRDNETFMFTNKIQNKFEITVNVLPLSTIRFIGGGNLSTQRKPPTCNKSLTNDSSCIPNYLHVNVVSTGIQDRILITHGTDAMLDTGAYLAKHNIPKTITITGAFLPEAFKDSDADFNVGLALGALQTMDKYGVYIAMVLFLFAIVLSVFRRTASGYSFGIFKLFSCYKL